MSIKYFFKTFGCRVNQYETQVLRERLLVGDGVDAAEDFEAADVCVINTCTVTHQADRDALLLVRRIARRNPAARLVVTGCLASRAPEIIRHAAPAAIIVGNAGKDDLPALLGCAPLSAAAGVLALHGRSRAYVKIQDGCNMTCSFCIISSVRSVLSCRPLEAVLDEVRGLIAAGTPEIVLCGIRLGRYLVQDKNARRVDLVALIERILEIPGNFRIRLSSLEITDATDRLAVLMAKTEGKLCPSLHLPLQSGCDTVLRRMRRWYSADFYSRRVAAVRAHVPKLGLFTDVMTGFPGETDAEHAATLAFIRHIGFAGLHVFRYSRRAGTAAALLNPPPESVVQDRARQLRSLDFELRTAFAAGAINAERVVALELDSTHPAGAAEDFLDVRLEQFPGPGLHRVRVVRADGPLAYAVQA